MKDLQEKVESDATGRAAISGLILFVLMTLLASNLSDSPVRTWLGDLVSPVRDGLGLDQAWGVFAPDPRSQIYGLQGRITYDDGTNEIWSWPRGDPIISEFRAYHWQKWSEQVRLDDQSGLWRPFAVWLARRNDRSDKHPTDVTLIRYWADLNPPGTKPTRGQWNTYEFFTLQVDPSILAVGAAR